VKNATSFTAREKNIRELKDMSPEAQQKLIQSNPEYQKRLAAQEAAKNRTNIPATPGKQPISTVIKKIKSPGTPHSATGAIVTGEDLIKDWSGAGINIGDKVTDTGMTGVNWNKFGGWNNIASGILGVWNKHGFNDTPTFTSGKRSVEENARAGGNKNSRHLTGDAFDLRNHHIKDHSKRFGIFVDLLNAFNADGLKVKGTPHSELDGTDGEHFHFRAAAKGFLGTVNDPTLFLTGESGPEDVFIQPRKDPSQQTNFMRNMGADMSFGMGGFGGGGITTVIDSSTSVNNASVLAVGNGPHPAPIDDGLHR
jgi:hypothetical protein